MKPWQADLLLTLAAMAVLAAIIKLLEALPTP